MTLGGFVKTHSFITFYGTRVEIYLGSMFVITLRDEKTSCIMAEGFEVEVAREWPI